MKIKKKDLLNRIEMLEHRLSNLNIYDFVDSMIINDGKSAIIGKFLADIEAEKQKAVTVERLEKEMGRIDYIDDDV